MSRDQVCTRLHLDDIDLEDDNTDRPQAGPCVRKEYRRLTREEIRALHAGLQAMKETGEYGVFVRLHRTRNSPGAHFGCGFFGWHRVYLSRYVQSSL